MCVTQESDINHHFVRSLMGAFPHDILRDLFLNCDATFMAATSHVCK